MALFTFSVIHAASKKSGLVISWQAELGVHRVGEIDVGLAKLSELGYFWLTIASYLGNAELLCKSSSMQVEFGAATCDAYRATMRMHGFQEWIGMVEGPAGF